MFDGNPVRHHAVPSIDPFPASIPSRQLLAVRRADHDAADAAPRRAVRRVVDLHRLPLRVAGGAEHLPRFLARRRVEVLPEVGGDRVVGDVAQHARLLAVLDLPERIAAELAVEALLIDRVAAAAVDQDAVLGVGDDLLRRRRSRRARLDVHVRHAQERIVAPRGGERAALRRGLADVVRGLAVGLQIDQPAFLDDRPALRLHAVIVVADGAHAARRACDRRSR